jgi:hypothetical protein
MRSWYWRTRYYGLVLATTGLFALNGCGLSDRQLASIWQSVLSTGLNTIVTNLLTGAIETTT